MQNINVGDKVKCKLSGLILQVDTVVPARESFIGTLPTTLFLSHDRAVFTRRIDEVTKVS